MATPANGTVVLVKFPFSDLSATKLRPAVVLAQAERNDVILCQVTSRPYGDAGALEISESDLSSGGLRLVSFVRPSKLFTSSDSIILRPLGKLTEAKFSELLASVRSLFEQPPV